MKEYLLLPIVLLVGILQIKAQDFSGSYHGYLNPETRTIVRDTLLNKYDHLINDSAYVTPADLDDYLDWLLDHGSSDLPIGDQFCGRIDAPNCYTCLSNEPTYLLRWDNPIGIDHFGSFMDMVSPDYTMADTNALPAVIFPDVGTMAYKIGAYNLACPDGSGQTSFLMIVIDKEFGAAYQDFLSYIQDLDPEPVPFITRPPAEEPYYTAPRVFPSPFRDNGKIEFSLEQAQNVSLHIIESTTGRLVQTILDHRWHEADTYLYPIEGANWASGIYYAILQIGDERTVHKMVKIN